MANKNFRPFYSSLSFSDLLIIHLELDMYMMKVELFHQDIHPIKCPLGIVASEFNASSCFTKQYRSIRMKVKM